MQNDKEGPFLEVMRYFTKCGTKSKIKMLMRALIKEDKSLCLNHKRISFVRVLEKELGERIF